MNVVTHQQEVPDVGQRAAPAGPEDHAAIRAELERCLVAALGKGPAEAGARDWFVAAALLVRERLATRWVASRRDQTAQDGKRVCYLSMEFLLGRLLTDSLRNLGLYDACQAALAGTGHDIETVSAQEIDAALGNGGLGRLAACLLDSMATLGIPACGYGIRFEYGLFRQEIENGWQVEKPEHWLRHGYPWEFPRSDIVHPVPFHGVARPTTGLKDGAPPWTETDDVLAAAFDVPICGFGGGCVNTLRLWSARALREFDTGRFNEGDHLRALEARTDSENLSRVLYPGDATEAGQALRFRQEYFFVSASVQDILAEYCKAHDGFDALPDKVAISINDTHPSLAVAELMRLLIDRHNVPWARAWDLTRRTIAYTNHTLMPEALETWPVRFFETILPRHLQIIYRINEDLLRSTRRRHVYDHGLAGRISLIDEHGDRRVRMAHLAFAGSHRINGVSEMHTALMRRTVFAPLDAALPGRIVNVTNGITPRRWLATANPALAALITARIGRGWLGRLDELERLAPLAEDSEFRKAFRAVKHANKERLARHIADRHGIALDPAAMLDVHVKRVHEYKRQLLKLLHAVALYNRIRAGEDTVPRTVLFAGKAAPGYAMAKLIIKLIHDVARVINRDPAAAGRLSVFFLPDYGVSEAQLIIPAAELSEQISTAGTEASGTGNMKLALNGALTIGTLDGANIEIAEAVGEDNFFAFGLTMEGATALRARGHHPRSCYEASEVLRRVLDMVAGGVFSPDEPVRFRPLVDGLLDHDPFLLLADFDDYLARQADIEARYRDPDAWNRSAILNVARIGGMSSDRAVAEYAARIWNVPVRSAPNLPGLGA